MASITDLTIRIGASVANLKAGLNKAEKLMKRSARKFERIGSNLTTKLSVPLGGIGAAALKAAGDFEVLENGLTAVIGMLKQLGKKSNFYSKQLKILDFL